jgi:hypothetical protein
MSRRQSIALAIGATLVGLVVLLSWLKGSIVEPGEAYQRLLERTQPDWLEVDYSDLVDYGQFTHSGMPLKKTLDELRNVPGLKGEVQPFLDPFAAQLIDVADMDLGPSEPPFENVSSQFVPGTQGPAWVALTRNGKFIVATDGKDRARVFLQGTDPTEAYDQHYGLLRHILSGLVPAEGARLSVQVFAFQNDYLSRTLKLNRRTYSFEASQFAPKPGVTTLDLEGLELFFSQNPVLEGASLSKHSGLVLYGQKGSMQTVGGRPVNLSDLAVAYRAAAHAGDNAAYVSLDPSADPTRVSVNFGGYLEDSAIGSVVLTADKRFKTLTTGLDPRGLIDVREEARRSIPGFMTANERDFAGGAMHAEGKWESTRFWFYPDSIEVQTDIDGHYARVSNARFTADAERGRDDFADPTQFQQNKKNALSPAIRASIDHLNANYDAYSGSFPELRELDVVARLMAISSWLAKSADGATDLDALLSLNLPVLHTERTKDQLLATATIKLDETEHPEPNDVLTRTEVRDLTPILNLPIGKMFDLEAAARFLSIREGDTPDHWQSRVDAATRFLETNAQHAVRDVVKDKRDLEALVSTAAARVEGAEPAGRARQKSVLKETRSRMETVEASLSRLRVMMDRDPEIHNQLLNEYNSLVDEYNSLRDHHNAMVRQHNSGSVVDYSITEIGGGIDLEPKHFRVTRQASSALLTELERASQSTMIRFESSSPIGSWIKSRANEVPAKEPTGQFRQIAIRQSGHDLGERVVTEYQVGRLGKYWVSRDKAAAGWRDQLTRPEQTQRERHFDSHASKLDIVVRKDGKVRDQIEAHYENRNRIVLTKSGRAKVADPGSPPFWVRE